MRKLHIAVWIVSVMTAGCQMHPPAVTGSDWIETQMFFGLTGPGGARISDADWHDFVDRSITPRFPDGLTIQYGQGQYRGDDAAVYKEPCAILVLLHPPGDDSMLNQIAREYDLRFHQKSVLRADLLAKTSFISAGTQP